MKPPISYYGGKQRLVAKLLPLMPKHTVYVEPFCGGATLLFAKPWPKVTNTHHYREVINDIDERLINFYRVLQDPELHPQLIAMLQLTPYSESEYRRAMKILQDPAASNLQRAWAYFVNIQQSFNRKLDGGWCRSVFSQNQAATWVKQVARLPQFLERLSGVHIACTDALDCIKEWDSPQTLFYLDPPYPDADQGHYSGYTQQDFERLCEVLDSIQGSFLLSNYDNPACAKYNWERFEFKASCSAKGIRLPDRSQAPTKEEIGDRSRLEIVWRKLGKAVRPEIQSLFDSGAFDCFPGGLLAIRAEHNTQEFKL